MPFKCVKYQIRPRFKYFVNICVVIRWFPWVSFKNSSLLKPISGLILASIGINASSVNLNVPTCIRV